MHHSAKTEYACLAVLELAIQYDCGRPIRVSTIAQRQEIPARFLVQILLQLKGAGLVTSTRGSAGGYRLAKPPQEITLWQVSSLFDVDTRSNSGITPTTSSAQALYTVWQEVAGAKRRVLDSITFADLVQRVTAKAENMYYI